MTNPEVSPELDNILPPAAEQLDDLPPFDDGAPFQEVQKPLTPDDLKAIEGHVDAVISTVAGVTADTLPAGLRDEFEESFTTSRLIRAGVAMTGMGEAIHELIPTQGSGAAGPVKQLHPVARVLLGVVVLGIGAAFQRRQILARHHIPGPNTGGPAGPADSGVNVPSSQGGHYVN